MFLTVMDVDRLKEFNYIYGDKKGDDLLKYIVKVFREEVPEVQLFRYRLDYFVIVEKGRSNEDLDNNVKKVQDRFARDIENGVIQPFDTSAGVRRMDPDIPLAWLINDAMIAREAVKGNHLLHHAFYDEEFTHKRTRYMEMESALPNALKNKEFHVYYQPKYDIPSGKIIGAEALVRWVKEDGAIISPGEFIPCFESSRQIILLNEEMLKQVCAQMKKMQDEGIKVQPVSVNLSRVHLRHPDILPNIQSIIRESRIDPSMLSFEITESALLEESIPLRTISEQLRSLGCMVDMDDYGVGASGPKALASNCFDVVKLDKSFVDEIGDEQVEEVIKATIYLADKFGMETLAEGVETKQQAARLMELGCTKAQGFYYSKPVPMEDYVELLRAAAC